MIDLSSPATAPAKPGLLPFALDAGGNSDSAPDAAPNFALTLTDLMTGTAPANTPAAGDAKPAAGRQKAAATGASLPELVAPMADDTGREPIVSDLAQDASDPAATPPVEVANDPVPDLQLEPALAWLLPPVAPPPATPLRPGMTVRGTPVAQDATFAVAVGADTAARLQDTPEPATGPAPGKADLKTRARPAGPASITLVSPLQPDPRLMAAVAVPAVGLAAQVAPAAAVASTLPAPLRYARTAVTSATIRAAALPGAAPPARAAAGADPGSATPVAAAAALAPFAPTIAPAPPLPVSTASAPAAASQPAFSAAAVAAASTTTLALAAPQPVTSALMRPDRVAPLAAPSVEAERIAVVNPPTVAGAAAVAAAIAVEAPAPRRVDDPIAPVSLSAPLASAQPIAIAAAGGAQQAGIDLTRDPGLHRMIDRIETLRDAADARDTRIRLIPDSLGPVDVSVRQDGPDGNGAVRVHFSAAEAATRQLIADAQPRLTELAEARGVRIERATVDGGQSGDGQAGSYPSAGSQTGGANTGQPRSHAQPQQTANHVPASVLADNDTIDDRIA